MSGFKEIGQLRKTAAEYADEPLKYVGPDNPLRSLDRADLERVYEFLRLYQEISSRSGPALLEQYENAGSLAADAGKLAERLRAAYFKKPLCSFRGQTAKWFKLLISLLELFAYGIRDLADEQGKQGHKDKCLANKFLVAASELVRIATGRYHYAALAEFYQSFPGISAEDVSADVIRKRRRDLKKEYPEHYAFAIKMAEGGWGEFMGSDHDVSLH